MTEFYDQVVPWAWQPSPVQEEGPPEYPPTFFVGLIDRGLLELEAANEGRVHPLRQIPLDHLAMIVARELRVRFTGDTPTVELPPMSLLRDVITNIAIRNRYVPLPRLDSFSLTSSGPF